MEKFSRIKPETGENFSFNLPLIKDNLLWQSIFTGKNKRYEHPQSRNTTQNLLNRNKVNLANSIK